MKKIIKSLLIIALILSAVSCKGDKEKTKQEINYVKSVLIYDTGSLWTENADGEMEWYTTLQCGISLDTYPTIEGSTSTVTESKLATRNGETEKIDYTKVRFNENDYWIQSALIIPNATPKVIVADENVHVYNTAEITDISNAKIPVGTIVAHISTIVQEDGTIPTNFDCISYRDGNKSYRNVYIKSDDVAKTTANDVMAERIIRKYKTIKKEAVKKELVESLSSLTLCPYYSAKCTELKNELFPPEEEIVEAVEAVEAEEYVEEESSLPATVTAVETDDSSLEYDDYYEFE